MRPPRLFERLLTLCLRGDAGSDVAADLAEEFAEVAARRGVRPARAWYRRQVARSVASRIAATAAGLAGAIFGALAAVADPRHLRRDLGPILRGLRRAPWYTSTATAVVALGLALAATVFAIVDGVLFRPLPFRAPHELFRAIPGHRGDVFNGRYVGRASLPDVRAWGQALPEASFTAITFGSAVDIADNEYLRAAEVDERFLDVLGVRPILGGFAPADFGPPAPVRPAILSYGAWQRLFGGDPAAIGQVRRGTGEGMRVVGVLPRDFTFPHWLATAAPEALLPRTSVPSPRDLDPRRRGLDVIVRLPRVLAPLEAAARATAATAQVARAFPPIVDDPDLSEAARRRQRPFDVVDLVPLHDDMTYRVSGSARAVFLASAILVALAALNLAGLAASRAIDRRREIALRHSLGAGAGDLVRVIALENAVVVGAGCLAGLLLARLALVAVGGILPVDLVFLKAPAIDLRVVWFALLVSAFVAVAVTTWSARPAMAAGVRATIAATGGTTTPTRSAVRGLLVAAQVALAFVVAVGGALFAASFARVWALDPGFQIDDAAKIRVALPPRTATASGIDALVGAVVRVPGVAAAGGFSGLLLERAILGSSFETPAGGREPEDDIEQVRVTAGTFAALGLRPTAGRLPDDDELRAGARVIAVSETVAAAYFPGRDAVGESLANRLGTFTIVGVVPDIRHLALDMSLRGQIYSPVAAEPRPGISNVIVTFRPGAGTGLGDVIAALAARHPEVRVVRAETMRQALGATVRMRELQTWLFVSFGAAALVVTAVGILGVIAMTASRRTREIGLRVALGSTPGGLVALMTRESLPAVAAGLGVGAALALWLVRYVGAYLYDTPAHDPIAWSAATVILLAVTAVAAVAPAIRASRVDPIRALRVD